MPALQFSAYDVFAAAHCFSWHHGAPDTAALANQLAEVESLGIWRACLIYTQRFRPCLENIEKSQDDARAGRGVLMEAEALRAVRELVKQYNSIGVTEIWMFQEYLDSDPAAWTDWVRCLP